MANTDVRISDLSELTLLDSGDFFADISGIISALLQLYDIPIEERKLKNRKQELITRIRSNVSIIDSTIREELIFLQE